MQVYHADPSLKGKLRRRLVRMQATRPAPAGPKRPMVSFSFDDAPSTAARTGAGILESRGVRGTYFVSMGLAGQDGPMGRNMGPEEVRTLVETGHEIGCHTHSHLDCGQAGGAAATDDVERNLEALLAAGAPKPATFAYPYGDVSAPAKAALRGRFALLRALHHGVIRRGSDLNQAPGVGIEGPGAEEVVRSWLRRTLADPGWLIIYTHDVREDHSAFGCTPGALTRLLDEALQGGADVVTVAEGCRLLGVLR